MTERATGLTEQQIRFAEEYCIDLDQKRAAITAGYAEASASQAAARLMKHPLVLEVIAKAQTRFAQKSDVTKAWVVCEAKATYMDAKGVVENGKLVSPMDFTARLRALDLLARLHGFFIEPTKTVRIIRGMEDLTEDELLALAAEEARGDDVRH